MSEPKTVSEQERDWKAESDARTLAMADAIGKDPERFKKAQTAAGRLVKDAKEYAEEQEEMTKALERLSQKRARAAKYKGRYPKME